MLKHVVQFDENKREHRLSKARSQGKRKNLSLRTLSKPELEQLCLDMAEELGIDLAQ